MTKNIWITGFALFSLFFGAGNLILPPYLGLISGDQWIWVTLGFLISAVLLPLLGILVHARLQGTMMDFAKQVGPVFSLIYCSIVYVISVTLPSPRTASVTHEMAIAPFLNSNGLLTSTVYFILVLLFVVNRSKILSVIGKYLSPILVLVIIGIIGVAIMTTGNELATIPVPAPVVSGLLEGYQTFDTIGATVVGGVLIISLKQKFGYSYQNIKSTLIKAAGVAGTGLLAVYSGLIFTGASFSDAVNAEMVNRTAFLTLVSTETLGTAGSLLLSVLVSLACFTTAVGIVTGTADFVKGICKESQTAYYFTAVIACVVGVLVGQLDVANIILVAIPALLFIYPITIVLIFLNLLPVNWQTKLLYRGVITTTIVCMIPDFIGSIGFDAIVKPIVTKVPLGNYTLGWLLPSMIMGLGIIIYQKHKKGNFS